jgi:hypothetical protein
MKIKRKTAKKIKLISCIVFAVAMMLMTISGATAAEWDNVANHDDIDSTPYGKYIIKNWLGLGDTLAEYTLIENTNKCFNNCHAIGNATLLSDSLLFDNILFENTKGDSKETKYTIYYSDPIFESTPSNYEVVCSLSEDLKNLTEKCETKATKYTDTFKPEWHEYKGESLHAGDYYWMIVGEKKYYETVDWIAEVKGTNMKEWITWEAGSLGYGLMWGFTMDNTSDSVGGPNQNTKQRLEYGGSTQNLSSGYKLELGAFNTSANTGYMKVKSKYLFNNSGTMSMWVNFNTVVEENPDYDYLPLYSDGGWNMLLWNTAPHGANPKKFQITTDQTTYFSSIVDAQKSTWYHVVVTWNSNSSRVIYVNGQVNGSDQGNYDGTLAEYSDGANFYAINGDRNINGKLDSLMIWNRSLTAGEVASLYNSGNGLGFPLIPPNIPPTITSVNLTSSSTLLNRNGTLSLAVGYNDDNGDPQIDTEIKWYQSNLLNTTFTNATSIYPINISKGENWTALVRVSDGEDYSVWNTSNSIIIHNYPPTASEFNLTADGEGNSSNSTITIHYIFSDAVDTNDTEQNKEVIWYHDDIRNTTFENMDYIYSGNLTKGEVWYSSMRLYDGDNWSEWTKNVSITMGNTIPSIAHEQITSSDGANFSNGTLTFSYVYSDYDGEAESERSIRWFKNGLLNTTFCNMTIVESENLSVGEIWEAQINVYDGYGWSGFGMNASITITNIIPVVSTANLSSSSTLLNRNGTLTAQVGYYDSDGQAQVDTEIKWYQSNLLNTTFTNNSVIQPLNISKGENWTFIARVSDGIDYSNWNTSNSIIITNHIPQVINFNVTADGYGNSSNSTITANGTLYDSVDTNDTQQSAEYIWYQGSVRNTTFNNNPFISSGNLTKGEVWYSSMRFSDGDDYSIWTANISFVVGNTIPSVPGENLTSSSNGNYSNSSITFRYIYFDYDGDSEVSRSIRWYKNDEFNSTFSNMTTIESANLTHGEVWKAQINVYDGTSWSGFRDNVSITLINSAPTTPTTRYPSSNQRIYYNTTIQFNCSGSTDHDLTSPNYEFWIGKSDNYWIYQNSTTNYYGYTFNQSNGTYLFNCRANDGTDTSGFFITNISIYYNTTKQFAEQENHNAVVQAGTTQTYRYNLSLGDSVSDINAVLLWNETTRVSATETNYSNKTGWIISKTIPFDVPQYLNHTWKYNLTLLNGTVEYYSYNFTQNYTEVELFTIGCEMTNSTVWAVMNLSFRDDENESNLTGNIEIAWTYWLTSTGPNVNKTFSTSRSDINSTMICMSAVSDADDSYSVNAQIQYHYLGYDYRDYFLYHYQIDNITDYVHLYQILTADATKITFHLSDESSNPKVGYYIYAQKYDIGTDTYKLSAMGLTNDDGEDLISLRKDDAWYRFIIKDGDGNVVFTSQKQKILSTDLYFTITETTFSNLWDSFSGIDYSLIFDNSSRKFTASYSTETGVVTEGCLQVYSIGVNGRTEYCDTCVTSASSTISCTVPVAAGNYIGTFYIKKDSVMDYINDLTITELVGNTFNFKLGKTGLLLTLVAVATMSLAGVFSPIAAVVLGVAAFILMAILGVLQIGYIAILGIALIAIIIISRLRD